MELSKIQTADLSEWKATELADQLAIMAGEGKPADMSQDEYNSIVRKVVEAYNAARKAETSLMVVEKAEEPKEETLSEEEFARNAITLNKYEAQTSVSKDFKSVFDRIDIVEGKKSLGVNLSDEVFEAAKLGVSVNSVTDKQPLSQQEYNERLQSEIAEILSTMILTKPVDEKAGKTKKAKDVTDANDRAKDLANIFDPNFKGKVKVSNTVAGATFATYLGRVATKAEELMPKYNKGKNKGFFSNLKDKFNKLDQAVTNKLKQKYQESKAVVSEMIQNGTWKEAALGLGLGATAFFASGTMVGVGAAACLTLMTAVQTYRRGKEFWSGYKAAKAKNKKVNFFSYTADNWKDAAKVVLYAGATVAGGAATYYNYIATAAKTAGDAAAVATAADTAKTAGDAATITTAADTAKTASLGKLGLITTATSGTHVADAGAAAAKGDWKQAGSSMKKAAFGIAGMAITYWLGSDHSAHASEMPTDGITPADSTNITPADSTQVTGTDVSGTDVTNGSDVVTTYSVEPAGAKEMIVYERNMMKVPEYEKILENIDKGLIKIPEGMSPAEAINHARISALNYGDTSILDAMKDCDGVQHDMSKVLYDLHNNSYTKIDGVHQLGDRHGFVGDNCRHGTLYQKDPCEYGVKGHNICKDTVYNNDTVPQHQHPQGSTPDEPTTPPKSDIPNKQVDSIDLNKPAPDELSNNEFRHIEKNANNVSQQAGDNTYKLKSTPATDAEIKSTPAGQVDGVKTNGKGLLLGTDGKPLNISFSHNSGGRP